MVLFVLVRLRTESNKGFGDSMGLNGARAVQVSTVLRDLPPTALRESRS